MDVTEQVRATARDVRELATKLEMQLGSDPVAKQSVYDEVSDSVVKLQDVLAQIELVG